MVHLDRMLEYFLGGKGTRPDKRLVMAMAAGTVLSIRVPPSLAARLDRMAKASARTRSFVALRALESYCENEEELLKKIRGYIEQRLAQRRTPRPHPR